MTLWFFMLCHIKFSFLRYIAFIVLSPFYCCVFSGSQRDILRFLLLSPDNEQSPDCNVNKCNQGNVVSQNVYSGLFCFEDKGPDQFKTSFRTPCLVLLFHDDFKKNSHVSLCCCRVKLFRRCFVHCRVCLAIADCGKPVPCNDAFVNEVFLDSICSSFA